MKTTKIPRHIEEIRKRLRLDKDKYTNVNPTFMTANWFNQPVDYIGFGMYKPGTFLYKGVITELK